MEQTVSLKKPNFHAPKKKSKGKSVTVTSSRFSWLLCCFAFLDSREEKKNKKLKMHWRGQQREN